jgi:hypothetical protein
MKEPHDGNITLEQIRQAAKLMDEADVSIEDRRIYHDKQFRAWWAKEEARLLSKDELYGKNQSLLDLIDGTKKLNELQRKIPK